jgi:hypothetical protein
LGSHLFRVVLEDINSCLLHILHDFLLDRRQVKEYLGGLIDEGLEGEGSDKGGEEVETDNHEVEDDKFLEVVVVSEPRPALKQSGISLLLDLVVLDQQQSHISMQLLRHNLLLYNSVIDQISPQFKLIFSGPTALCSPELPQIYFDRR